ncbi:hypothetical protein [Vibrio nigripulchritudo]|uniref:hypothetical protein n=1 Tax=Vibrio nigripulchritudo TaxID=28173 RepID=UPI002491DC8F|nr:hypothetical protein [Vibrio nigripulchritudo]BDU41054.1 hypothetical protein TUMSATVNIG2_55230 [Vibrio nigripulchritudo]BDU46794.1 hypothetical protein TUMSATVNIG3_55920 [Vibrio nigripulchritudo]
MPVTAVKGDFCNINGFTPSDKTIRAIDEMNHTIEMTSLLEKIMMIVPLVEIFMNKGVSMKSTAKNVTKFDWEQFAQSVKGISKLERSTLERIAISTADRTMGKEREFWLCVYNAL